jgi:hypothetical protein
LEREVLHVYRRRTRLIEVLTVSGNLHRHDELSAGTGGEGRRRWINRSDACSRTRERFGQLCHPIGNLGRKPCGTGRVSGHRERRLRHDRPSIERDPDWQVGASAGRVYQMKHIASGRLRRRDGYSFRILTDADLNQFLVERRL